MGEWYEMFVQERRWGVSQEIDKEWTLMKEKISFWVP